MAVECDETDELSGEIDLVNVAITPLIEVLTAGEKVRAALQSRLRLN
jgi:hypothetical protein